MTDREEHNAELDAGYWADEEEETENLQVSTTDTLEWLISISEEDCPDVIHEFLLDALGAMEESRKFTVYVLAANFSDKYESEIKEFLREKAN